MNALELRQWLNNLEENGHNLEHIPIMFLEFIEGAENIESTDYVGWQTTKKDVNIVNVKKFNEESNTTRLKTQFDNAIVIGPIIECD